MALTFASYAVPGPWWAQRAVAVACVVGLAALNYRGVTKTALLTRVLVATSLTALTVMVVGIVVGGHASTANLDGWSAVGTGGAYGDGVTARLSIGTHTQERLRHPVKHANPSTRR
jgi:basic amino acid/polyamine antiporter, APA family